MEYDKIATVALRTRYSLIICAVWGAWAASFRDGWRFCNAHDVRRRAAVESGTLAARTVADAEHVTCHAQHLYASNSHHGLSIPRARVRTLDVSRIRKHHGAKKLAVADFYVWAARCSTSTRLCLPSDEVRSCRASPEPIAISVKRVAVLSAFALSFLG